MLRYCRLDAFFQLVVSVRMIAIFLSFNPLALELDIEILAQHLCKM